MIRNLKVLGLALMAACAMSAVASSAASAAPGLFTAAVPAGTKAGIHGGQVGNDTFTIGTTALTCTTATLSGEAVTAGPSSTYVTLKPTYDTCHVVAPIIGTLTATVTTNNCNYTFNATKGTSSGGVLTPIVNTPFSADLTIQCPIGKSIEVHIYNGSKHIPTGSVLCTYDIGAQTINNQIQLTNIAASPTDILAHVHATVNITNTKPGGICTNNTTAIYEGTDTLTATNGVVSVTTSVS